MVEGKDLVWVEQQWTGDRLTLRVVTPDRGPIYEGTWGQEGVPVQAMLAARGALEAAQPWGRN